ncbi:MAG: ABC transporter substrate-binding protein [Acidobacteria bacterium]|nr:ABC transporter substrate-binding protein [Acidobacteriota bacterium]
MKRLALLLPLLLALTSCNPPRSGKLVIACKNFTEQVILGELLAQEIEAQGEPIERRFYLAGSYIAHQALVAGRVDAYVEYSGTALSAVLKQPLQKDPAAALATIRRIYAQKYHVTVAAPLGFEDTFAMIVRGDDPRFTNITKLSQLPLLAPTLRLGTGYEFQSRPDGLPAVEQTYNLHFNDRPRVMDLGLLYRALAAHQVDIVSGNSTDGAIEAMRLRVLQDDRHAFPPYEAVPLVRTDSLQKHPALQRALEKLAGQVSAIEMRAMNQAVDGEHRDPADVVRQFRAAKHL